MMRNCAWKEDIVVHFCRLAASKVYLDKLCLDGKKNLLLKRTNGGLSCAKARTAVSIIELCTGQKVGPESRRRLTGNSDHTPISTQIQPQRHELGLLESATVISASSERFWEMSKDAFWRSGSYLLNRSELEETPLE